MCGWHSDMLTIVYPDIIFAPTSIYKIWQEVHRMLFILDLPTFHVCRVKAGGLHQHPVPLDGEEAVVPTLWPQVLTPHLGALMMMALLFPSWYHILPPHCASSDKLGAPPPCGGGLRGSGQCSGVTWTHGQHTHHQSGYNCKPENIAR